MTRVQEELGLLRAWFGDIVDYLDEGQWVRLRTLSIPSEIWTSDHAEVAFQIPPDRATNPYGFYARGFTSEGISQPLAAKNGQAIGNYTYPASTPWGGDWGRFSWQLQEWTAREPLRTGTTMVHFARSITDRFGEGHDVDG